MHDKCSFVLEQQGRRHCQRYMGAAATRSSSWQQQQQATIKPMPPAKYPVSAKDVELR
jgi:hypothetical protein